MVNNWKKVENFIGTRTGTQIRSHAQKFFNRIKKDYSTEDPSKYVIDNMTDESIRKIIREHWGEDVSNSNDEKDFQDDTPEVLFSITKEKLTKRKRDDADLTPRSIGTSGSAFKSFKREEAGDHPNKEDSKIHKTNTIITKPIWKDRGPSQAHNTTETQYSSVLENCNYSSRVPMNGLMPDINTLVLQAMLNMNQPMQMDNSNLPPVNNTLTHLLTKLNRAGNIQ